MFKSKLSKENSSLKSELLLTKKALNIYKNDQQEFWNINYLDFKGEVIESIKFKSEKEFEKEIRESNNIGRPIDYQLEGELER